MVRRGSRRRDTLDSMTLNRETVTLNLVTQGVVNRLSNFLSTTVYLPSVDVL